MKLFAPEHAGKHVWQVADAKTRSVSYTANNSTSPPPDAVHGHPLGKYDTFPAEKIPMIRALAKKYGLKWGGDFKSRPDDMHFEVEVSATKAKQLIEKLGLKNE